MQERCRFYNDAAPAALAGAAEMRTALSAVSKVVCRSTDMAVRCSAPGSRFYGESGSPGERALSHIERDEFFRPDEQRGGDVDDVERAAAERGGMGGGEFLGRVLNEGGIVGGPLPASGGHVLLEGGDGLVHFRRGDFSAKGFRRMAL